MCLCGCVHKRMQLCVCPRVHGSHACPRGMYILIHTSLYAACLYPDMYVHVAHVHRHVCAWVHT